MEDILEFDENELFWLTINSTNDFRNTKEISVNSTELVTNLNETDYNLYDGDSVRETCHSFDIKAKLNYWNVTCDAPIEYVVPLYGYCMPFLLLITVLANSLIVLILRRKNMNSPTNFVLMGKRKKDTELISKYLKQTEIAFKLY